MVLCAYKHLNEQQENSNALAATQQVLNQAPNQEQEAVQQQSVTQEPILVLNPVQELPSNVPQKEVQDPNPTTLVPVQQQQPIVKTDPNATAGAQLQPPTFDSKKFNQDIAVGSFM